MIWGFVLIAAVVVGWIFIMILRRRLREPDAGVSDDAGFSLSQLRAMRDRGEITSEEYEQTRSRVIAKVKAAVNAPRPRKGTALTPPGGLDAGMDGSIIPSNDTPDSPSDGSAHDGHH